MPIWNLFCVPLNKNVANDIIEKASNNLPTSPQPSAPPANYDDPVDVNYTGLYPKVPEITTTNNETNIKQLSKKELKELKKKEENEKKIRDKELKELKIKEEKERQIKEKELKENELREKELREKELKEKELKELELKKKELIKIKTEMLLKNLSGDYYYENNYNLLDGDMPANVDTRHILVVFCKNNYSNLYILKKASNLDLLNGYYEYFKYCPNIQSMEYDLLSSSIYYRNFNLEEKKILAKIIDISTSIKFKNLLMKYM
jgi:hypothetical protein